MPCQWITMPDGTVMHLNMGRGPRRRCKFCRAGYVTKLCDFPVADGKTCDAAMCDKCATNVGPETDHCPKHRDQAALFGGARAS